MASRTWQTHLVSENAPSIQQRARAALVSRALLRRESLITLGLTALLASSGLQPLPDWQPWYWLVGGALALVALAAGHLNDEDDSRAARRREFASQFNIDSIRNATSRERLRRALEYSAAMQQLVDLHQGALRESLRQTVADVEDWIDHMVTLARHIDTFEENELIARDLRSVPRKIEQVQLRLEREQDPALRSELQHQLEQLRQQLENLNATVSSGKRAAIRLENTLSSLGTVHAQMTLLGTRKVDSAGAQRLRLEIQEELGALQDTIEAMDEMQAQSLHLR